MDIQQQFYLRGVEKKQETTAQTKLFTRLFVYLINSSLSLSLC